MRAQFPGHCVRCPDPIDVGDKIVPHADGYIHRSCASGHDDGDA